MRRITNIRRRGAAHRFHHTPDLCLVRRRPRRRRPRGGPRIVVVVSRQRDGPHDGGLYVNAAVVVVDDVPPRHGDQPSPGGLRATGPQPIGRRPAPLPTSDRRDLPLGMVRREGEASAEGRRRRRGGRPPLLSVLRGRVAGAAPAGAGSETGAETGTGTGPTAATEPPPSSVASQTTTTKELESRTARAAWGRWSAGGRTSAITTGRARTR